MYFSKIHFCGNPANAFWQLQNLGNVYKEHQFIWQFFPAEKEAKRDFLYRRISASPAPEFYLVSKRKPKPDLQKGLWSVHSKEYHPKLKPGRKYAFSLRANPVVTKKVDGTKPIRNDIIMEARAQSQEKVLFQELLTETAGNWLEKQGPKKGFSVTKEEILVERYLRLRGKKDRQIQIGAIDYSGILSVTDTELFLATLYQGIGKARSFGCGLFLLRPIA